MSVIRYASMPLFLLSISVKLVSEYRIMVDMVDGRRVPNNRDNKARGWDRLNKILCMLLSRYLKQIDGLNECGL